MAAPKSYIPKNIIDQKAIEALENTEVWQEQSEKDIKQEYSDLEKLRYRDIEWRLQNRQSIRNFLFALLVGQNLFVFIIFAIGMWFNKISGLDAVFTTLVGGTLIETTSLIYIIVKWLFSEIPYQEKSSQV